MQHTPTRQLPACELVKRGIGVPFFHPSERDHLPVNYHLTVVVLDNWELEALTIAARKHAAKLLPNPNDNRDGRLDYPATPKEQVNLIRHMLINRTINNLGQSAGYQGGYDNLLHKIAKKGVDVEARQRLLKLQVLRLIATHYPTLAAEAEYQSWLIDTPERSAA